LEPRLGKLCKLRMIFLDQPYRLHIGGAKRFQQFFCLLLILLQVGLVGKRFDHHALPFNSPRSAACMRGSAFTFAVIGLSRSGSSSHAGSTIAPAFTSSATTS